MKIGTAVIFKATIENNADIVKISIYSPKKTDGSRDLLVDNAYMTNIPNTRIWTYGYQTEEDDDTGTYYIVLKAIAGNGFISQEPLEITFDDKT